VKARAVEVEVSGAGDPEERLELAPQEPRARAAYARAERRVLVRPGEGLMIMPYARAARLVTIADVGGGAHGAPTPMQAMEGHMILDSIRSERVGTLAEFVEYLRKNDVVGGMPRTFEEHHSMQKYAYLSSALGEPPYYAFNFLENGAYSPTLALDLYAKERGGSGVVPFKGNALAGEEFAQMVRGRGRLALQAMTFAMRDIQNGSGRHEFVETMHRERNRYSRRLLERAFDSILEARGRLGEKNE